MSSMTSRFESGSLVIALLRTAAATTIAWTGESDSRNPGEFLNPLVAKLAKDLAGQNVIIDFSELTYMNSATVAPLIMCIKSLDATASSVLVMFSDQDWQRTHVQCVRTISRQLKKVRIEVRAKAGSAE
jgi:anti-anti-sigma regulatory factor